MGNAHTPLLPSLMSTSCPLRIIHVIGVLRLSHFLATLPLTEEQQQKKNMSPGNEASDYPQLRLLCMCYSAP